MKLEEFRRLPTSQVTLSHTTISYRRIGQGSPLLFIHGWPLVSATYRSLIPELSKHFDCILPDSPGLGLSSWSKATDFSFHSQAKTWGQFIEKLGLTRYSLVAHNTGATIARLLAHKEKQRVEKMVIFDTEIPGHRPNGATLGLKFLKLPGSWWVFRKMLSKRSFVESKQGFGYAYQNKALFNDEFYKGYVTPLLTDTQRWKGCMNYVMAIDWDVVDSLKDLHGEIEAPVKLIWGEKDQFFPLKEAEAMGPQFKNYQGFVTLSNAGLMSYEEKPTESVAAMLDFLKPPSQ
ncbi:MAG: alpha/beta hydrolase [Planctomycetota bacterium]|nr:alpha/beta hydrolase [Planctomycetota bacterium]